MNKEEIGKMREFDREQLKELMLRLKDIDNFNGFKDGAFKYYLGKYEADLLLNYIDQQDQIIREARELLDTIIHGRLISQYEVKQLAEILDRNMK